jgi:hypothetical protein
VSLDHARAFLYRVLPWGGDPTPYVNIQWTYQKGTMKKPGWTGRACTTIDECINTITWAQTLPDTRDIYVCMSTQRQCEVKTSRNGKSSYRLAIRGQPNAVNLKALFLDIDVKEGAYATTHDAIVGLKQFYEKSGMPKPTLVVASGSGGLHVYWVLSKPLTPREWQPLATALVACAKSHGLKFDGAVTIDSARVLRVPGTTNRKVNKPVELGVKNIVQENYDVDVMQNALRKYIQVAPGPLPTKVNGTRLNDELSAGIVLGKAPLVNIESIAQGGCGFIANALNNGGADLANPLWNLTTLISVFTEDAKATAHRLACGHTSYTVEETDVLFERKTREKEEKNLGWPSCSTIEASGCTACSTCPHRQTAGSPIKLGRPSTAPLPLNPAGLKVGQVHNVAPSSTNVLNGDIPPGFVRDANGLIFKIDLVKDSSEHELKLLVPYPLWSAWLQDRPWTLHIETSIRPDWPRRHLSIQLSETGGRDFHKVLRGQGFVVKLSQQRAFEEFIMAWIQKLQGMKDKVVSAAPYGWSVVNGKLEGFCYGGTVWFQGGERPSSAADDVIARRYSAKGELEPWLNAACMITDQGRPELDAVIGMSFGAPLMRFTGHEGALMSIYSTESGIGKTTAIKVAQAVWGDPIRGVQGLGDTTNSVMNKVGVLQHLPIFWDELKTEEDNQRFVSFAFQVSSGKEKSRMTAQVVQRETGFWQTIVLAASNDSLVDYINRKVKTTMAGAYRIFEYIVPPALSKTSPGDVARRVSLLNENHGHAGALYAKFLGENHVQLAADMAKLQDWLNTKLQGKQEERFWIATMACVIGGARYANELGLTKIKIEPLIKFLMRVLEHQRNTQPTTPVDMRDPKIVLTVLAQFLNIMRARHTLQTDRIVVSRGRPPPGTVNIIDTDLAKLDAIYVQHDSQIMRIALVHFRKWLEAQGYSPSIIVDALKQQYGARIVFAIIAGGTSFAIPRGYENLLEIDLMNPVFKSMFDGDISSTTPTPSLHSSSPA